MKSSTGGFQDKFLSKLGKIDRDSIRDYLVHLLSQKQFFETIFGHLAEGIIVTDDRLRVVFSNPMARRLLQWPGQSRRLGEELPEICPPGKLREALVAMRERPRRIDGYELAHGPQDERRLSLTAIPASTETSGGEREMMWVFILQDVTEHQRAMEERARAQRLASLALLTAGVAHEIKNPLNSLNIHAHILRAEADPDSSRPLDRERVQRAAQVILEETERLTRVVDEFIQAARPRQPVLERVSIQSLLEDLERLFAPECERLGIDLRVEVDPEIGPIHADLGQLFKALRNLVRNAVEAHHRTASDDAPPGEARPAPTIRIAARLTDDRLVIEVADNGPGIARETVDKIFEPYYTTKFGGSGLGLMIVDQVVRAHQGLMRVETGPGAGARFTILLPLSERPTRLLEAPSAAFTTRSPGSMKDEG
jgi:signal transduction histidine kinase